MRELHPCRTIQAAAPPCRVRKSCRSLLFSSFSSVTLSVKGSQPATLNPVCNSTAESEHTQRTTLEAEGRRHLILLEFPEQLNAQHCRILWSTFAANLEVERPYLRLDLSRLKSIDNVGVDILLDCVNETLRRDGDVEITSISREAEVILEITGIDTIVHHKSGPSSQSIWQARPPGCLIGQLFTDDSRMRRSQEMALRQPGNSW